MSLSAERKRGKKKTLFYCTEEKVNDFSAKPGNEVAHRRQIMSPVSVIIVSRGDTCTLATKDRAA